MGPWLTTRALALVSQSTLTFPSLEAESLFGPKGRGGALYSVIRDRLLTFEEPLVCCNCQKDNRSVKLKEDPQTPIGPTKSGRHGRPKALEMMVLGKANRGDAPGLCVGALARESGPTSPAIWVSIKRGIGQTPVAW
jgi:hypothetical protein